MTGQIGGENQAAQAEAWQGVANILGQAGGDFTKVDDTQLHQLAKFLDVLSPQGETEIYQKLIDKKNQGVALDYALASSFLDTGVPAIGLPISPEIPQGNPMLANQQGFQIFMTMYLMIMAEKEQKEALIPLIQETMKLFIEYAQTVADSIREAAATQKSILMAQAIAHFVEAGASMATFAAGMVKIGGVEKNIAAQKDANLTRMTAADNAVVKSGGTRIFTDAQGKPLPQHEIDSNLKNYYSNRPPGHQSSEDPNQPYNRTEDKLVRDANESNVKYTELKGSTMGKLQQDLFMFTSAQTMLGQSAKGISTMFEAMMTTIKAEDDATRAMYEQLANMKSKLLDQLSQAFSESSSETGKIQQQLQAWMDKWAQYIMGIQG